MSLSHARSRVATEKKAYGSKWYTQAGSTPALLSGVSAFIVSDTLCQLAVVPEASLSVQIVRHTVYRFKPSPDRAYRDDSQSHSCHTTFTKIYYHSPNDIVATLVLKPIMSWSCFWFRCSTLPCDGYALRPFNCISGTVITKHKSVAVLPVHLRHEI